MMVPALSDNSLVDLVFAPCRGPNVSDVRCGLPDNIRLPVYHIRGLILSNKASSLLPVVSLV